MHSDSRKAQHNSFAHHRANLIFTPRPMAKPAAPGQRDLPGIELRQFIRASLLGDRAVQQASPS